MASPCSILSHSLMQFVLLNRSRNFSLQHYVKIHCVILPRLIYCGLLLDSFLTTKSHPFDVEPTNFQIVPPTNLTCRHDGSWTFTCKIAHYSGDAYQICSKFHAEICLWTRNKCSNFSRIGVYICELQQFFLSVWKEFKGRKE